MGLIFRHDAGIVLNSRKLSPEIKEWLKDNVSWWKWKIEYSGLMEEEFPGPTRYGVNTNVKLMVPFYRMKFVSRGEAVAFKLRWG
jgi:hypothetical protein